ncbi:cytochrome P450 [Aspergillus cavernicola]|uniref:Cytochrome P450 n=1 Tax=Aspergillus cavernicola TaxID=176166 RepID=A0ABR4HZE9_9EURO
MEEQLHALHKTYPILRLAPYTLSFADIRTIKDIYGHGSPCPKDDVDALTAGGGHPHMLNVVNREEHARKRRMLSNAFAARNLQLFWSNLFTVDAIADIALSKRLGFLDSGSNDIIMDGQVINFLDSLHRGNRVSSRIIGAGGWFYFLRGLSMMFSPYLRSQWGHGGKFGGVVRMLAGERLEEQLQEQETQETKKRSDFFPCLIDDRNGDPRGLERVEIDAETSILLDSGADTTATALTNVIYYLIKNPQSQKKLRNEVSNAFSENGIVASYAKVKNLPYLKA